MTKPIESRPCIGCGVEITKAPGAHRIGRKCSACKAYTPRILAPRDCVECGSSFAPPENNSRVCGDQCMIARRKRQRVERLARVAHSTRWCDACRSEVKTNAIGACAACARSRKNAAYVPVPKPAPIDCVICGSWFVPFRRVNCMTCSPECRDQRERDVVNGWMRNNPERLRANGHRRRARLAAALVHDVPEEMVWEFNPAGPGCCNYCRKPLAFEDRKAWHVDHVVPISRGGLHEITNLVIACVFCNLSKHDRLLSEWKPRAA